MTAYAKVNGINGSATDENHQHWTELDFIEIGANRKVGSRVGTTGNREGSAPRVGEMTITKLMDGSSVDLYQHMLKGKAIPTVKIDVCHTGQSGAQPYCQYTLSNVIISNFDEAAMTDNHTMPLEVLTLNFTEIQKRFTPSSAQGAAGSPVNASYNLETMQVG